MTTITLDLKLPGGVAVKRTTVAVRLVPATSEIDIVGFRTASSQEIAGTQYFTPDEAGNVTMVLIPRAEITPANTRYEVVVTVAGRPHLPVYLAVPPSGTYDMYDVLAA